MPFDLLVRLEYMTAMLESLPRSPFSWLSSPTAHKRMWGILVPFAPFALFEVFLPLYWLTWSIFLFYGIAIAAMIVTTAMVLARAAYRRIQGGRAMFVGGRLIGICAINDILYSSHLIRTGNWLPDVLALFVFLQSMVLAKRFTSAFDEVGAALHRAPKLERHAQGTDTEGDGDERAARGVPVRKGDASQGSSPSGQE